MRTITALIILAEGHEEIETITPIDILHRAGITVTIAGLTSIDVTGAHGITTRCDATLETYKTTLFDAIIIPGGMPGTLNLLESSLLNEMLKNHFQNKKICCAICAAPRVLAKAGILEDKEYTCYPGTENEITSGVFTGTHVVQDGSVITGEAVGSSQAFSLAIVEALCGITMSHEVAQKICFKQ